MHGSASTAARRASTRLRLSRGCGRRFASAVRPRRRAMAVSAVAGALAIASAAIDLRSIWVLSSAPRSQVTINLRDMGDWWRISYPTFVTANEIHVPVGALVTMEWSGPQVILWHL